MIDRHELLATLKPLVTELEDSIRERALSTPEVAAHLEQEHHKAVVAERTAMSLEEWRDGEITQAAVAWVLGCVFVRFLEDNGLIDQALISGSRRPPRRRARVPGGALPRPSRAQRPRIPRGMFPCGRRVSRPSRRSSTSATTHSGAWRPTADGARALRETFTAIDPGLAASLVHDFTDPDLDTRFLGDLYQDLSEAAKKRYALLQTPEFVERFILDRTLDAGHRGVRARRSAADRSHLRVGPFPHRGIRSAVRAWREREPGTNRDGARPAGARPDRRRRPQPICDGDRALPARDRGAARCAGSAPRRGARVRAAPRHRRQPAARPAAADGAAMLFDANRLDKKHRACLRDRGRRTSSRRSSAADITPSSATHRTSLCRTRR